MLPPAPERFSTTTCWPRRSPIGFCRMRAVVSVPPPGSNPTTTVTGLFGEFPWAIAPRAILMPRTAAEIDLIAFSWFPRLLVRNDVGTLDDGAPLLDFVAHEGKAVFGRSLDHGGAARFQRRAHLRILRRVIERFVEA